MDVTKIKISRVRPPKPADEPKQLKFEEESFWTKGCGAPQPPSGKTRTIFEIF
jgi:hypothetical protein